jgi:hypothetical protein
MNRKASICVVLVFALVSLVALGAGAQGKGGQAGNLGIVFNVQSLLMQIAEASDEVTAGVGLKYWLAQKSALRGIVEFAYASNSATNTSSLNLGLSAAYEYHFVKARVSPYVGGLAGFHVATATGAPNDFAFYLAGILGAEVTLIDSVALFAEYNLRMLFNDPNFNLGLTLGNNFQIGLIIYLP